MKIYEELVARGLIAQVTDEERIRDYLVEFAKQRNLKYYFLWGGCSSAEGMLFARLWANVLKSA